MEILIVVGAVVLSLVGVLAVGRALRSTRPGVPEQAVQPSTQPTVVTTETAQKIAEFLSQGQKIHAIKLLREQTGLGLADTKKLIDTWPNGVSVAQRRFAPYVASPTTAGPLPTVDGDVLSPDVVSQIDHLVAAGQKIHAIKLYRTSTGVGLKDAKDRIDAWVPRGNVG